MSDTAVATPNRHHSTSVNPVGDQKQNDHLVPGRSAGEVEIDTSLSCDNLMVVRERIAEVLLAHDEEDFVVDVQLVATELAANACDHADDPRRLVLRREIHPDRGPELVIEARDATVDTGPVLGISRIGPTRGRGLQLVESLCVDWGVRVDRDTKVVWARLPMPEGTTTR